MPTVEDYFDDDTDLPLPSASGRHLPNTGLQGALLEEIGDDLDMDKLQDQGRGEYGANSRAPPPSSPGKGKAPETAADVQRPQQPRMDPNTPMGGFMGDMMKLQEVEEERIEKLRRTFGNTKIAQDPSVYKSWNTVYPRYFDAKVSVTDGRRVPRKSALWWPQATHIAQACASLGLPSVLEPEKTHPADWENPGRVKVQLERDGRPINPIVKNRTQLYTQLARQMQNANPKLVPAEADMKPRNGPKPQAAPKGKAVKTAAPFATRPPAAPVPLPRMDERLPVHSPTAATGVAVSSVKRDLEAEKEAKKKGLGPPEEGAKAPKMKRIMVRGKR
ncbi:signal recognition particle, SRP19 subunit [Cutaneotrichosporon oleaginosum]|uniref:Signal recognition particle, SRP19 subunit n=1 Tax=Cutaneotrichosporon oleaginosum TaxID=879819 RepID=A0A0J1B289_9TREE|nr:signal recognition particle, SRP19 subunit [Cutaneotrichosporon oleaginosum]KLT41734.1 signal recognition particle, SRP19 subunit [Cutaneotrichosporon oleaginosum]TXT12332.1 hypothetical protein COLE_02742 [Cutaneotrichosporon oleaginosum]